MKTRGYAARSPATPLTPFEFDRRPPGDRDVHVRIDFCGICHSDIHVARNEWRRTTYPCVPGHEIVGRVVATGRRVTEYAEGQRVAVGCMVDSCRQCANCQAGHENYCEKRPTYTYNSLDLDGVSQTFGGYSTQIVVDERFVLGLPDRLDPAASAPLLCAGVTTYAPMRAAGLTKGSRLAVVGLGGLGHMAVKLGVSFGAAVTVLSRSPGKEADARRLGADDFVLTTRKGALSGHAGRYDVVLDTVAAGHDLTPQLSLLQARGTLILVGMPASDHTFDALSLISGGRRILGSPIGSIAETREVLDHCGRHGITSDIELITPDRINEAFERTIAGDVKYRFVVDCSAF
ncbi:MAG: NAD(P)-dependent alcohol dehydrogenase [Vicinamibacterales bacterium]